VVKAPSNPIVKNIFKLGWAIIFSVMAIKKPSKKEPARFTIKVPIGKWVF
jgi:hypothetical protein